MAKRTTAAHDVGAPGSISTGIRRGRSVAMDDKGVAWVKIGDDAPAPATMASRELAGQLRQGLMQPMDVLVVREDGSSGPLVILALLASIPAPGAAAPWRGTSSRRLSWRARPG